MQHGSQAPKIVDQVDRVGFATIVKKTRKEKELSQIQLSEKCKQISNIISPTSISMIENGNGFVEIFRLAIVAQVLGLKLEDYKLTPPPGIQGFDHPPEDNPTLHFYNNQPSQESEPIERDEQKTEILRSHKGTKRKASQISEATLEQLSKFDDITSELIIKAQNEWGLNKEELATASGVTKSAINNAQTNVLKTSTDILERIVCVLQKGPGHRLPNRKQQRKEREALTDRKGFAHIVKNTRKAQKLSLGQLAKKCEQIIRKVPRTTIFRIEKGDSPVDISSLAIVAQVLGLKLEDYLLTPTSGIQLD